MVKRQMFLLEGLSCPSCAAKLEKAAKGLPGMKAAQVSFGSGSLKVEYDDARLSEAQVRHLVKELGLQVATVLSHGV